jgi:membrane protein DedA with SNARE-associated domain
LPLSLASVSGPLINLATNVISDLGLAGVAVMMAMSNVVALPGTEPTMLFAGFDVYRHHLTLGGIIGLGVVGDLVGATIAYAIGYWGSREVIEHYGSRMHLSASRLDRANEWANRYGPPAVFLSRLVPGARFVFPYAAGIAQMSYVRFIAFAALGSAIWVTGLGFLGRAVGANWQSWRKHLEYVDYAALALIIAVVAWVILRRVRSARRTPVDAVSD